MITHTNIKMNFSMILMKEINFRRNIRGLKVRGTYNTREEAEKRAKSLQSIDSEVSRFCRQVGYWLP